MTKAQLNLRVSDLTARQIKDLTEWWGVSKTELITVLIDRAHRQVQAEIAILTQDTPSPA